MSTPTRTHDVATLRKNSFPGPNFVVQVPSFQLAVEAARPNLLISARPTDGAKQRIASFDALLPKRGRGKLCNFTNQKRNSPVGMTIRPIITNNRQARLVQRFSIDWGLSFGHLLWSCKMDLIRRWTYAHVCVLGCVYLHGGISDVCIWASTYVSTVRASVLRISNLKSLYYLILCHGVDCMWRY
jgi:hypothetical protein